MVKKMMLLLMVVGFMLGTFVPKQLQAVEDPYIHYILTGETPPNL